MSMVSDYRMVMPSSSEEESTITNNHEKSFEYDDDDAVFADIGLMLEGSLPSTVKHFVFPVAASASSPDSSFDDSVRTFTDENTDKDNNNINEQQPIKPVQSNIPITNIQVALHVVDDDPGAIQSGHSLWPAAPALCKYMTSEHRHCSFNRKPQSILELGAGCALVGLTALQLYKKSLQCLIVTDRDPGALMRARDSYESTLEELYETAETEEEQLDRINILGSIPVEFETLEWETATQELQQQQRQNGQSIEEIMMEIMTNHNLKTRGSDAKIRTTIDMILGSDLIYSHDVVEPLLMTAYKVMNEKSIFWLAQSFEYDAETEEQIEKVCNDLNLQRTILVDTLGDENSDNDIDNNGTLGPVKIQEFTRRNLQERE